MSDSFSGFSSFYGQAFSESMITYSLDSQQQHGRQAGIRRTKVSGIAMSCFVFDVTGRNL
jgi:hypothetical protein